MHGVCLWFSDNMGCISWYWSSHEVISDGSDVKKSELCSYTDKEQIKFRECFLSFGAETFVILSAVWQHWIIENKFYLLFYMEVNFGMLP